MWHKLFINLTILQLLNAQMYFIEDKTSSSAPTNLSLYAQYVHKIMSRSILKLILDVNKANAAVTSLNSFNNIVYSPINIVAALALLLMGSSGRTLQEISSVIDLENRIDMNSFHNYLGPMLEKLETSSNVNFANAIFVQEGFPIRESYRRKTESIYHNQIQNVDFANNPAAARRVINSWASQKTDGKIKELIKETVPSNTKAIIASAMYFKAAWEIPFFDDTTRKRPFYTNGRKAPSDVEVEMMLVAGKFPYYKDGNLNCEIIGFPYKGKRTTMYVVIPRDSNKQKLKRLESQLHYNQIERLVSNVRYTEAHIGFPKMHIDSSVDLKQALQMLGVRSLFNPIEANLSQLSSKNDFQNPGLYADSVLHKVYMDITESGTEAAVITAVTIEKSGGVVSVLVDVPFFFFMMNEETKALLFWGSIYTPTPNF